MRGLARARGEVGDDHGEDDETDEQVGAAGHVSTTADRSVDVHRFGRVRLAPRSTLEAPVTSARAP
jgi:hypothetical protein